MSDRRESDTVMSDVKPIVRPTSVLPSAQEPHQTHTPPEEAVATTTTTDAVMSESSEGPKKRGWPKGRPRAGAKKATAEKAPSKRAAKANLKAAKARDVFVEAALEAQKDTRRRHSSSQTPAPDMLERAPKGPRAQSVPREVPMIVREVTPRERS